MRTWGSMITKGQMVDAVRNIIEEDTGDEFDDYGLRWRKVNGGNSIPKLRDAIKKRC